MSNFFHIAKFSLFHVLTLIAIIAFLAGSYWIAFSFLVTDLLIVLGDHFFGDDESTPEYKSDTALNAQLYLALPLLLMLVFAALWQLTPGDALGFGAWLSQLTGYDFVVAKEQTVLWQKVLGVFYAGLLISTIGTVTGHEFVHRTWDAKALVTGRWLLAFSFDANFSIEHVFGHHRRIGTEEDPATAPRGRNVYQHIVYSSFYGNISAWQIEKERLQRKKLSVWSWHNTCIRGYLMSVALLIAVGAIFGLIGLAFFVAAGLWAKCMLEIVNYVEHYGIVRLPKTRVEPRHSWNTNRLISSWSLFNLSRHSHHHAHGQLPYHKLKPYTEAPTMVSGYLACVFLALFPPLWFKLMEPKLEEWDRHFASDAEKDLLLKLKDANA